MKKRVYTLWIILALLVLLGTAGCITDQKTPASEPADIPKDMQYALDDLTGDMSHLEKMIIGDLADLASELQTAKNTSDIRRIMSTCYAEHPCLTAIVFRDVLHGEYLSVPVFVDTDLSAYAINITEQDFRDAGGLIIRNNVFAGYHGYQNLYYKPVYREDGTYHGYVVFVTDGYSLLYLHPDMIDTERSYDSYICTIADNDGKILYSSIPELTGEILLSPGYSDGLVWLPLTASGDGACTYTSGTGFYLYDKAHPAKMMTAWHTMYSSHGHRYTLYITRPVNQVEMKTENVFSADPQQAQNDVLGAYVYATQNGKNAVIQRVNNNYYQTPMMIIDMDGNVLAATNVRYQGKNLLGVRSMYGVSYVGSAVLAAEQGSGYIYYLKASERTASPRAAQYTLGMVMPVDDYFIFCSCAGAPDAVMLDPVLQADVTRVSHAVLEVADTKGVEAAIEMINANGKAAPGLFAEGLETDIADIAILDVEGNVYASIQHPELVGKSATFMTDVYGGSLTRRSMTLAQTGSGYLTQLTANPEKEGYVDLWHAIVEPIDDTYYIYTSVYIGTFEDILTPCLNTALATV